MSFDIVSIIVSFDAVLPGLRFARNYFNSKEREEHTLFGLHFSFSLPKFQLVRARLPGTFFLVCSLFGCLLFVRTKHRDFPCLLISFAPFYLYKAIPFYHVIFPVVLLSLQCLGIIDAIIFSPSFLWFPHLTLISFHFLYEISAFLQRKTKMGDII